MARAEPGSPFEFACRSFLFYGSEPDPDTAAKEFERKTEKTDAEDKIGRDLATAIAVSADREEPRVQ